MLTVVIATRNRLEMLQRAVRGVLEQSEPRLELIVVNDASTDGTPDWLNQLTDPRVRVIHHETPQKASGARNAGARAAKHPFVSFVDDDDEYLPDKVRATLEAFATSPKVGVVVSGFRTETQGFVFDLNGSIYNRLSQKFYTLPPSILAFRRELFLSVDGFDPTLTTSEDYDICLRLSPQCEFRSLDAVHVVIHHTPSRLSGDKPQNLRNMETVVRRHFSAPDGELLPQGRKILNNYKAGDHAGLARLALDEGQRNKATRLMFQAAGCEPLNLRRWAVAAAYALLPEKILLKTARRPLTFKAR